MPKKTKSTKKSRITIERDGNEVEQVFDQAKFKKSFDKWKDDCAASGEDLRMKTNTNSLLDMVANHGKTHRPQTKDKNAIGASEVVKKLSEILDNEEGIEEPDQKFIDDAIKQLEEIEKENNPRNILFTIPIVSRVNRKTLEYDEDTDVVQIYGHYRTPDYVKFRNLKAKLRENVDKEDMPPAPTSWWDKDKDKAKPPLWQALFADGDGDVVSKGLLPVLREAAEMVDDDNIKLQHLRLRIKDSGSGATAKDLWSIPEVQKWVKQQVGKENNPGVGINKTSGNFRDSHYAETAMPSVKFPVKSIRESNFIKDLAGFEDIVGNLITYSVIITRRQMRNLAILAGCKKRPGKDTVYMPGVAEEDKVVEEDKESDTKLKMDWRTVLKGN
tara:strand:- start:7853 stop:9010 length:1158 start_codon:yes stop_codon:yes gene_type:complete